MRVLCLTGSIGMGKSTAANTFRRLARAGVRRRRRRAPLAGAGRPRRGADRRRLSRHGARHAARPARGPGGAAPRRARRRRGAQPAGAHRPPAGARRRAPLPRRGAAAGGAAGGARHPPAVRDPRRRALRRGAGGDGARRRAAPPRAAASGHDGGAPRVPSWRGRCPIRRSGAAPTTSSTPACRASTPSAPSGPSSRDTGRRHDAADRARHRDHRPRPGDRRPRHRDRGDRAGEPGADGARVAHPARPRARRAGGKHARPRLHRGDAARQAEIRGEGRGVARSSSATRRSSRTTRPSTSASSTPSCVRAGRPRLDRARMVDSLAIAKKRFLGMPNSLDALCRRLGVDNSMRTSHNALLDVRLLAQVYLELMGGRQPGLRPRRRDRRAGRGGARRRADAPRADAAADRAGRGGAGGARGVPRQAEGPAVAQAALRAGGRGGVGREPSAASGAARQRGTLPLRDVHAAFRRGWTMANPWGKKNPLHEHVAERRQRLGGRRARPDGGGGEASNEGRDQGGHAGAGEQEAAEVEIGDAGSARHASGSKRMRTLRNAVVVVTGASSGIGRATALEFARRGARVVLAARRAEPLDSAAAECRAAGAEARGGADRRGRRGGGGRRSPAPRWTASAASTSG